MRTKIFLAICVMCTWSLIGCASGPEYQMIAARIPTVPEAQGRIYFYRSSSPFGAAVQPDIRLNGEVVGQSIPGGFFFVDRPPGNYEANCTTETKQGLTFTLAAGETRYIATVITMGAFVGRVQPVLQDAEPAMQVISKLSYTGNKVQ